MNCPFCDSVQLRTSRYRSGDFVHYLMMRRPVRCRTCQERTYVSLGRFRQIQRESMLRRQAQNTATVTNPQRSQSE
jgi:hypothetical protein